MSQYRESREDKFRRLAEARVNKILHLYRLLGNLSWTGTYAYTKDQVDQIFTELQAELLRVKLRFLRTQSTAKKRFALSEPYAPEKSKISEDNPTLAIPLPDGTYLRAVGYPTDTYPCIDIYWDNGINIHHQRRRTKQQQADILLSCIFHSSNPPWEKGGQESLPSSQINLGNL